MNKNVITNKNADQKPNPIYAVMQSILKGETPAKPIWIKNVELKKSKSHAKNYFLIKLEEPQLLPETAALSLLIEEHHISIYQNFSDKCFGLTAYHYTAIIIFQNRRCSLHGYFDKYGILHDILLQDEKKATLLQDNECQAKLRKILCQFTVTIMTEFFNIMDELSEQYDKKLESVRKTIDQLSKQVFAKTVTEKSEAAYPDYIAAIREYIKLQESFNEVCLEPDLATLSFLRHAEKNTPRPVCINPQPLAYNIPIRPVKDERTPQVEAMPAEITIPSLPITAIARIAAPKIDIEDPNTAKLKIWLHQLKELESKKTTASSLCHEHSLINQCLPLFKNLSEEEALALFIRQNNVLKRAKIALNLTTFSDDADSASQLLSIVKTVRHDSICQAALRGSVNTLSIFLGKYHGPKMILYSPENRFHYDLTIHETLPNNSLARLLAFGCNPNALTLSGFSLLHIAAQQGNLERVHILLDSHANIDEQQTKGQMQIFLFSSNKAELSKANKNFSKGALRQANARLPDTGCTPIMYALEAGHLDIAAILIEKGCDLSIVDKKGFTFQSYGLMRNKVTKKIKEEVVKYLVEVLKVDINKLEGLVQPQTALHFAVQYRAVEDAELLLKFGANPNMVNRNELDQNNARSSFSSAVLRRYFDLMTLMLTKSKKPIYEAEIIFAMRYFYDKYPGELDQLVAAIEPCPYVKIRGHIVNHKGTNFDAFELIYNQEVAERILNGEDITEHSVITTELKQ
jgi:ankyrin repeat protein